MKTNATLSVLPTRWSKSCHPLSDETLKKTAISVVIISVIVQIFVMIYYWDVPLYSDAGSYIERAKKCYMQGTWYPNSDNIYDYYIWSLGNINWLILQLKLFGTTAYNAVFNLLFELGIVFNIYYISNFFFTKRVSYVSIALYSILYSNLIIVVPTLTQLPYLLLVISAFSLCLKPTFIKLFLAGVLFTLGNSVRPLAVLFLISSVVYLIFFYRLKYKYYFSLLISISLCVVLIGCWTYKNTGHFIYQSSTSGYNLIMVANDEATGGVINVFGPNDAGWIENADKVTYEEKDKIFRERAVAWIIDNPGKYILGYFKRLFLLYVEDAWSDRYFAPHITLGEIGRQNGFTVEFIVENIIPRILKGTCYYIVLFLGICSLFSMRKEDWKSSKIVLLLLFVLGTCATCIFPPCAAYHHPYVFIIVIWAAWYIEKLVGKTGFKSKEVK
ncbi:hypothetical protein [uncultured Bacteroides sp.]|uniref:hypothetical protein n=1 Tax=uncultured Bacteroides sp. TaxID=162156 RepID=UPI002638B274|nr:hypothetical protein [uncultured Bacteroides sp.]